MKVKRIIALALALVMCFAFAACNNDDAQTNDPGMTNAEEGQTAENMTFR